MGSNSDELLEAIENVERLLIEQIKASNRTTRAVRAFVRFLFIQLVFITAALGINVLGTVFQDPAECAYGICPPNTGAQVLAGFVWLIGVFWSSAAGFSELGLSEVPSIPKLRTDRTSIHKLRTDRSRVENIEPPKASPKSRKAETQSDDGERRCSNCGYQLNEGDVACVNCDSWQIQN